MNYRMPIIFYCLSFLIILSCTSTDNAQSFSSSQKMDLAKITAVECIGQPSSLTLSVTIESPDTGCDQYADWWEVFYPDSTLIYRRILGHSHVTEQPFTRTGGTFSVGLDEFILSLIHI